jgi:hypothetical protein
MIHQTHWFNINKHMKWKVYCWGEQREITPLGMFTAEDDRGLFYLILYLLCNEKLDSIKAAKLWYEIYCKSI